MRVAVEHGERPIHRAEYRDIVQRPCLTTPGFHFAKRHFDDRRVAGDVTFPDDYCPIGIGERHGPEQNGVDDSEDADRSTDRQAEQANGQEGKAWVAFQIAESCSNRGPHARPHPPHWPPNARLASAATAASAGIIAADSS
jgi:hypothetical protein